MSAEMRTPGGVARPARQRTGSARGTAQRLAASRWPAVARRADADRAPTRRRWSSADVLEPAASAALIAAANALEGDLAAGLATLEGEDVHSAVEVELTRRAGQAARRLHTGRSRNDQVVTLLRMRVMDLCDRALEQVRELAPRARVPGAARRRAGDRGADPPAAGAAGVARLICGWRTWPRSSATRRVCSRHARPRICMPLGAGAVAGTPLRYDRAALAARLGFSRLADNSLDAVGDRDFALEYLNAAALLGIHVSRLAEDLVLACSPGFGWLRAPEGLLDRLEPPAAEAQSRRVRAGARQGGTARRQRRSGSPLCSRDCLPSYQKDLQEDKEAVFDSADTLELVLRGAVGRDRGPRAGCRAHRRLLATDLLAVELADALVELGVPFRDAHEQVGRLWATAERHGTAPAALPSPSVWRSRRISPTRGWRRSTSRARSRAATMLRARVRIGGRAARATRGAARARTGRSRGGRHGSDRTIRRDRGAARGGRRRSNDVVLRRATVADVPGIAALMAEYVVKGLLLPRPMSELVSEPSRDSTSPCAVARWSRAARSGSCGMTWARCARWRCARSPRPRSRRGADP